MEIRIARQQYNKLLRYFGINAKNKVVIKDNGYYLIGTMEEFWQLLKCNFKKDFQKKFIVKARARKERKAAEADEFYFYLFHSEE